MSAVFGRRRDSYEAIGKQVRGNISETAMRMKSKPTMPFAILLLFFGTVGDTLGENAGREDGSNAELPDAVTKPPAWLGEDLPFDQRVFFDDLPDRKNAAPLYLEAFYEFDRQEMEICFPNADANDQSESWEARKDRLDKLYDLLGEESTILKSRLESVLSEYRRGLELLEQAQQREQCVFQSGIGFAALIPHAQAARTTARVLVLQAHQHLTQADFDGTLDEVKRLLRLSRDLRPRGSTIQQIVSVLVQRLCLEYLVPPMLESEKLTVAHCERLLQILAEHQSLQKIDPLIESERYSHLAWKKLLHQLERGHYDPVQRAKELGLRNASTIGSMLVTELHAVGRYEFNADVVQDVAAELSRGNNAEASRSLEEIQSIPGLSEKFHRVTSALALTRALDLDPMTNADYRRERQVLNQRYRQIANTAGQPVPQRITSLRPLVDRWTVGDQWRETQILKLFHPKGLAALIDWLGVSEAYLRSAIAATALRRWMLLNELPPDTLVQVLESTEMKEAIRDPFSGKPLKMAHRDGQLVIYSVGPDGDDDRGETQRSPVSLTDEPVPDGDISFAFKRPTN